MRNSLVTQVVKNPPTNVEDPGSIPGSGRSLETEMTTHSSVLENSMDREAWWATVHRFAKSLTGLSDSAYMHSHT